MDISRWHRNTSLLSMSLSIDSAFRKQDRDADVALVPVRKDKSRREGATVRAAATRTPRVRRERLTAA